MSFCLGKGSNKIVLIEYLFSLESIIMIINNSRSNMLLFCASLYIIESFIKGSLCFNVK